MQEGVVTNSIFEAAMRLHETLDPDEVVARALAILPSLVEADAWSAYLKAEQFDRLDLVLEVNPTGLPVSPMIEMRQRVLPIAQAVREQRTIFAHGHTDAPDEGLQADTGELARLCVPLLAGKRLIGAIEAVRRSDKRKRAFGRGEAVVVETICQSLAWALSNALDYHTASRQTLIDDLTRLYNARYMYQRLDSEIRRAHRYDTAVSVVFMDLDGFKLVNDNHGHRAGSLTLREVAEVIVMSAREADFVARYGGDEFVLMLPETTSKRALQMAERVRACIAEHIFTGGVGAEIHLTASFGVASFPEHAAEAEKLIELADAAMYEAKQRNKNNVRLAVL